MQTKLYITCLTLLFLSVTSYSQKNSSGASFTQKEIKNLKKSDSNIGLLLGGCWFVQHVAIIHIKFHSDFTFDFSDYDASNKEVLLTGTYSLNGHDLWLNYSDRSKEKFYFYKSSPPDNNYYIKRYPSKIGFSSTLFVHGECE
jgi:hypothetical protein